MLWALVTASICMYMTDDLFGSLPSPPPPRFPSCHVAFSPFSWISNLYVYRWWLTCVLYFLICKMSSFHTLFVDQFEGRKYCEHDFHVLYAPCCKKCGEFVIGRVIKAMNSSWHPDCFHCQLCDAALADTGFVRNMGRWVTLVVG